MEELKSSHLTYKTTKCTVYPTLLQHIYLYFNHQGISYLLWFQSFHEPRTNCLKRDTPQWEIMQIPTKTSANYSLPLNCFEEKCERWKPAKIPCLCRYGLVYAWPSIRVAASFSGNGGGGGGEAEKGREMCGGGRDPACFSSGYFRMFLRLPTLLTHSFVRKRRKEQ